MELVFMMIFAIILIMVMQFLLFILLMDLAFMQIT